MSLNKAWLAAKGLIELTALSPPAQPGFTVQRAAGRIDTEALFTGKLTQTFTFRPVDGRHR